MYTVGQKVLVLRAYGTRDSMLEPLYEATVAKVGRTMVYVTERPGGSHMAYRVDGGYARQDPAQTRILTPGELAEERDRAAVLSQFDVLRVPWGRLTAAQLRAIQSVVEDS